MLTKTEAIRILEGITVLDVLVIIEVYCSYGNLQEELDSTDLKGLLSIVDRQPESYNYILTIKGDR